MGQKSAQLPCFERVQHLKEKSRVKNFFALVNREVAKVYLSEKILGRGGCGTLSELEKQLFSRDILLTFAKRPEKPLVKTREIRTLVLHALTSVFFFFFHHCREITCCAVVYTAPNRLPIM